MVQTMTELLLGRPHMIAFIVLFLWGLYIMVTHHRALDTLIETVVVFTAGIAAALLLWRREP